MGGNTDKDLIKHVQKTHREQLRKVTILLPPHATEEEKVWGAYNEAIATVVRQGAPLASYSIDRRCLYNYTTAVQNDKVQALICFCCARRFPYLGHRKEQHKKQDIDWTQPLVQKEGEERFCGLSVEEVHAIFSLETYLERYGKCDEEAPDLRSEVYDDWCLTLPFSDKEIKILCCPEDRECEVDGCLKGKTCCSQCWLPLCRECKAALDRKREMPAAALMNDMMIFYAPTLLYTQSVTVMEMICASPCLTSMICFTLEARYRNENPFDSQVHMAKHRMGARGNVTSFPLPWQELLKALKDRPRHHSLG